MYTLIVLQKKYYILLFCFSFLLLVGCSKNDDQPVPPIHAGLQGNKIIISDIQGIPESVVFDRVEVEINGKWWEIIDTVKGEYDGNRVVLELPENIDPEKLSPSQWSKEEYGLGYWDATSTEPNAGVAGLNEIVAFNGTKKVGRIYLSDWSGNGSSAYKAFINYQYAEKEFSLSGLNSSYIFSATFKKGWNAYAKLNTEEEGRTNITTSISEEMDLHWRFESWVYN